MTTLFRTQLYVVERTILQQTWGAADCDAVETRVCRTAGVGDRVLDVLTITREGEEIVIRSSLVFSDDYDHVTRREDRRVERRKSYCWRVDLQATANWGDQYEPGAEYQLRDEILTDLFAGRDAAVSALRWTAVVVESTELDLLFAADQLNTLHPRGGTVCKSTRVQAEMDACGCPPGCSLADWRADNDEEL